MAYEQLAIAVLLVLTLTCSIDAIVHKSAFVAALAGIFFGIAAYLILVHFW